MFAACHLLVIRTFTNTQVISPGFQVFFLCIGFQSLALTSPHLFNQCAAVRCSLRCAPNPHRSRKGLNPPPWTHVSLHGVPLWVADTKTDTKGVKKGIAGLC